MAASLVVATTLGAIAHPTSTPPASAAAAQAADDFVFDGGGYGHGVGMSQYGALGRAQAGHGYPKILRAYYPGTQIQQMSTSAGIRVLLSNSTTVQLTPAAPVRVLVNGTQAGNGKVAGPFTVNYTGSLVSVVAPSIGCNPGACVGADVRVPLTVGEPVGVSTTQRRYHRGQLTFVPAGPTMRVSVNGLAMQGYLYGVAEVPNSWPTAALRAQSVAARSFAENRIRARRAGGSPYDLLATTSDQNYTGFDHETSTAASNWVSAVNATAGRMLVHDGSPITALYSSSNGGHSERSGYVYVTQLPYLKASPDPFDSTDDNPNHRWRERYSVGEISDWLGRYSDTSVGTVRSIRIVSGRGVSGRVDKADMRIVGSARTVTVSGARLRSVINAGAPSGRELLSTLFTVFGGTRPDRTPFGSFDEANVTGDRVRLVGWAIDRDKRNARLKIHVYVDGELHRKTTADVRRADVARRHGLGARHGFVTGFRLPLGSHRVCVYAINAGPGSQNTGLGCKTVSVTDEAPFGNLDVASADGDRIRVSGWAIDRDLPGRATGIHVYIDGEHVITTRADLRRSDVAAAHGLGADHGFRAVSETLPLGPHQVCVYAINAGPGSTNAGLGCRTVTVTDSRPFGSLDRAGVAGDRLVVAGWAIDADSPSARLAIHVYVDGRFATGDRADVLRQDVGRAHGLGPEHGFVIDAPLPPGRHTVCVYAINAGPGTGNTGLGCRDLAR